MARKSLLYLLILLVSFPLTGWSMISGYPSKDSDEPSYREVLIVKFKPDSVRRTEQGNLEFLDEDLRAIFDEYEVESVQPVFRTAAPESELGRTYKIDFKEGVAFDQALEAVNGHPSVEYAEPDRIVHIMPEK